MDDTQHVARTGATLHAYRQSLGLSTQRLAEKLNEEPVSVTAWESGMEHIPQSAWHLVEGLRRDLIDEVRELLQTEQELRQEGEGEAPGGNWSLPVYLSQRDYDDADVVTPIGDFETYNNAQLLAGLLLESMGLWVRIPQGAR